MITALCAVAGGKVYEDYAEKLMDSAAVHFMPTEEVEFHIIPGDEGWPNGTMMRWHHLLANFPRAHFVFLIDADMLMVDAVGPSILAPRNCWNGDEGIIATLHPGYIGMPPQVLPFERQVESVCCVPLYVGETYYCGGFVGGNEISMRTLGRRITEKIDADVSRRITPVWHDESALNSVLAQYPPARVLTPSYCHPANADWYRQTVWKQEYEPKIVAIDKPAEHRGDR